MKKVDFLWIACLVCSALALGACGSSDGGATADSGSQESAAGSTAADSGSQGGSPAGASATIPPEIERAVVEGVTNGGYSAQLTEVEWVEIDGAAATAEVVMVGGTLDGQTVQVELSKPKKEWKVDELTKFVDFDKALLVKNYEKETKNLPEDFSPAIVRCLTEEFGGSSQAKMEAMYLDQNRDLFLALGRICLRN